MRNLTEVFLNSAPSRFKLPFGVNKNVVLKAVDNGIRRDKNGVKQNKNCYMTFASLDPEDPTRYSAQTTFNYFNIDKPAYATKSFIHQFNQIVEIVNAVVPKEHFKEAAGKLSKALASETELFKAISQQKEVDAKTVKAIGALQTKVVETFIEAITPYLEDKGDKVNLVVITDAKGVFFDLPREDKGFITKAEGGRELHVDAKYARWYADKDKKETSTNDDIGGETVIDEQEIMVVEDDLDGI